MKKITIILITIVTLSSCVTQGGIERGKQYRDKDIHRHDEHCGYYDDVNVFFILPIKCNKNRNKNQ